ncbi:MAG: cell division protein FtsX [Minisyncoccia bacterium]
MFWINIKRITKAGYNSFKRGGTVTFASVLTLVITLSLVNFIVLMNVAVSSTVEMVKNKVDVIVYFVPSAEEKKILTLKENLSKLSQVKDVSYVSRAQALEEFEKKHVNDYVELQALNETPDNPFGAELKVVASNVGDYDTIANYIKNEVMQKQGYDTIIEKVNYTDNKNVIDKLSRVVDNARVIAGILLALFSLIAIVITHNTVRLTIYTAREEIAVMRLVGGSRWYVRGPFVVQAIISSTLAALITTVLFIPVLYYSSGVANFFGVDFFAYYIRHLYVVFPILLFSGAVLGFVSSLIATKKYLSL